MSLETDFVASLVTFDDFELSSLVRLGDMLSWFAAFESVSSILLVMCFRDVSASNLPFLNSMLPDIDLVLLCALIMSLSLDAVDVFLPMIAILFLGRNSGLLTIVNAVVGDSCFIKATGSFVELCTGEVKTLLFMLKLRRNCKYALAMATEPIPSILFTESL